MTLWHAHSNGNPKTCGKFSLETAYQSHLRLNFNAVWVCAHLVVAVQLN